MPRFGLLLTPLFKPLLTPLKALLLPAVCPRCHLAAGPLLCGACRAEVLTWANVCAWCAGAKRSADERCRHCDDLGLTHLDRVATVAAYDGAVRDLITFAKAFGNPAAVRAAAALMPSTPPVEFIGVEVVVPVPPNPGRRHGPHLGTALARRVARTWRVPWYRALHPTRLTAEQHRLSPTQRAENVQGLFVARFSARKPLPERVLLIDDLLTTGATLSAAAGALRAAGVRQVSALCLARTPHYSRDVPAEAAVV